MCELNDNIFLHKERDINHHNSQTFAKSFAKSFADMRDILGAALIAKVKPRQSLKSSQSLNLHNKPTSKHIMVEYFADTEYNNNVCAFSVPLDMSLSNDQGLSNRLHVARQYGFDFGKLTWAEQVHGNHIAIVGEQNIGSRIPSTDALITNMCGVCLLILTADCLPVLLFDRHKHVVAAVHAGWKGTAQHIVAHTVAAMTEHFSSHPSDIIAYFGPHICADCFEVGNEVIDAIGAEFVCGVGEHGNPLLNLEATNAHQLQSIGVEDINLSNICTRHNNSWPSWRRSHTTERLGSFIFLKENFDNTALSFNQQIVFQQ